jgi:hypothetical protein
LICFAELIDCFGVMSEIFFTTNEDDGQARAEMRNFVDPLENIAYLVHMTTSSGTAAGSAPSPVRYQASLASRPQRK